MRIGVVVDSTCDLSRKFLDDNRITVLPVSVDVDGQVVADVRDPRASEAYYRRDRDDRGRKATLEPPSVEAIRDLFLDRLVVDFDAVFCLTASANRSAVFANVTQASYVVLGGYHPVRQAAGHNSPFLLRVIDTQNLLAGEGLLAIKAVRMIAGDEGPGEIRATLDRLAARSRTLVLPRDPNHLHARERKAGVHGVGLFGAALGTALDVKPILECHRGEMKPVARARGFAQGARLLFTQVASVVRRGLMLPVVCVSFGGAPRELEGLPGYEELAVVCAESGVRLYRSVMSVAGMVEVGTGALSVGYAATGDPAF